jgi:hypothetical protein
MAMQVLEGPTIAVGESLSDPIDCRGGQLVRITMPYTWEGAGITFQFSTDGVFFNDMFGLDGYEVQIKNVVANSGVIIPADIGRAISFLKIRSGTRGNPIAQNEARTFAVTLLVEDDDPITRRG